VILWVYFQVDLTAYFPDFVASSRNSSSQICSGVQRIMRIGYRNGEVD